MRTFSHPDRRPAASLLRSSGLLQRQCACGQHTPDGGTCSSCAKQTNAPAETAAGLVNQTLQGPGQAIDPGTRAFMEPRLGHDFSGVRVHTGTQASASAAALHANAYTVGRDIVFAVDKYAPASREGRRLLAHELSHVVQQDAGGTSTAMFAKAISHPSDATEREAVAAADTIVEGGTYHPSLSADAALQGDLGGGAIAGIVGGAVAGAAGLGALIGALAGAFGSRRWSISQTNTDGATYSSKVAITFDPSASMHCNEIAFVQAARHNDVATGQSAITFPNYVQRRTATGWTLDRIEARKYGWYGYNNDGRPSGTVTPGSAPSPLTPAVLHDSPTDTVSNGVFEFETCAICRSGTDVNTVYGCFHWGFNVDASNKLTSRATSEAAAPSAEFANSLKQWNVQAAGPAAQRNDPNQQSLGPFK
jgi:hypothetical protein